MEQFDVYRNPNPATRSTYPLLLDIQSDLLADLATRVVAPLCLASTMKGRLVKTLMPVFEIDGKQYAMLTPLLAGIARKQTGAKVGNLTQNRAEIIAAMDLLTTGI
jgi:toxin CcdB